MQSINTSAVNSWFLVAFLGTSVASMAMVVLAVWRWSHPSSMFLLLAGLIYRVGALLLTIFFNVPMNESLASLTAATPDSAGTAWNHVRTIACVAATALLMAGLD
jgi:uncharacterized membrane protein